MARDARLWPLAEGPLLSAVNSLAIGGQRPQVMLTYAKPDTTDFLASTLLGAALAGAAAGVHDSHGLPLRDWFLSNSLPAVAGGRYRALPARWPDQAIPPVFQHAPGEPQSVFGFTRELQVIATAMSGGVIDLGTKAERDLIEILYESVLNMSDHGRAVVSSALFGVTIEKLTLARSERIQDRVLDDAMSHWLAQSQSFSLKRMVVILAVCDAGPGIHQTLRLPGCDASELIRLAFEPGITRKPPQHGTNRGLGLSNVRDAARRLDAWVQVQSGPHILSGAARSEKWLEHVRIVPEIAVGTTIAVAIPSGHAQLGLFGREAT